MCVDEDTVLAVAAAAILIAMVGSQHSEVSRRR